jgi:sarcosine oxidase
MRTEFAIVGGGLLGLSAAWDLTKRGHEALVIDQAPIGHIAGGSHGTCRIFRLGYEQPAYVSLAMQARDTWAELEDACGERLLHPTPQLTIGPELDQVRDSLERAGVPGEAMTAAEAAARFPGVAVSGPVLYEQHSAVIAADRALAALARLAGPISDPTRVTAIAEHGPGRPAVRVSTADGDIDADRVIVCAGPSTARLLAGAGITVPGSASMEQVAYLVPADTRPAAPKGGMPIFVHYGAEIPYGLPVPESDKYKIGIHFGGPPVDPDRQDHTENARLSEQIGRAARRFLPGFDPNPVTVERCIYDNSPDTDFIIDRVGNIAIGSGTSGHGFKFGPLIGQWLARLATGQSDDAAGTATAAAPPPWFALSRFAAQATVLLWPKTYGLSIANMTAHCTGT